MRVAIVGSRGITVDNIAAYLPENTQEIISGGAKGVDSSAREYALKNKLKMTEFLPEYCRYGKGAPLRRNIQIIEAADLVIAFWDGNSPGTEFVIRECHRRQIPIRVIRR